MKIYGEVRVEGSNRSFFITDLDKDTVFTAKIAWMEHYGYEKLKEQYGIGRKRTIVRWPPPKI